MAKRCGHRLASSSPSSLCLVLGTRLVYTAIAKTKWETEQVVVHNLAFQAMVNPTILTTEWTTTEAPTIRILVSTALSPGAPPELYTNEKTTIV